MNLDLSIDDARDPAAKLGLTLASPRIVLLLQIAAFWQIWLLTGARFFTSADGPWALLPLAAVVFFSWSEKAVPPEAINPSALLSAAVFLLLYAAGTSVIPVPFIIRGLLAIISITIVVSSWRFRQPFQVGIFALFGLSLPLTDSLNFFLGFPMRALVGDIVAALLRLQGLNVFREGVSLDFGGKLIWIDAPCSGIKMLWFGAFLAVFLSLLFRLGSIKILAALALTFIAVLIGNVLRASALFYIEGGLIESSDWMHSAVGVVSFAISSLLIIVTVRWLSEARWRK
ncbi:MAG: archaeosortase/exosortase family protein [Pyrinomonadaceae bacterium]